MDLQGFKENNMNFPLKRRQERMDLLTAREAAEYLRVSLSTLHRLERDGVLVPLRMPGGHRRYTIDMLNACFTLTDEEL